MTSDKIFTTTVEGATLILAVRGSVSSLGDDAALDELDSVIAQVHQGAIRHVLVDFGQSTYFGSIMLETLRRIWNEVHPRGGRMALCNVSPVGKEILQIAKFDQLWPIVETRQDADQLLTA